MRHIILQFIICFFTLTTQAQIVRKTINTTQLACLEKGEDNYIVYKNQAGAAFSLYIKNEYCDLLKIKMQQSAIKPMGNICLETNGRIIDLGLDETHNIMFPTSVSYETGNPNVVILEMDMVSFIATQGYTYLVIDLRDKNIIRYAEFSEKLSVKNLTPAFKKYRDSKYNVTTVNRS